MVQCSTRSPTPRGGSPHPRGDGPATPTVRPPPPPFSPPAWGWSLSPGSRPGSGRVLPTRVGMVRSAGRDDSMVSGSPHPRGDGPPAQRQKPRRQQFSPPAWGWSIPALRWQRPYLVLPTRVGMVLVSQRAARGRQGSPHPRGDGPDRGARRELHPLVSPPAWGWPRPADRGFCVGRVLPTRVGMVRRMASDGVERMSSPHPRGDGPSSSARRRQPSGFSPPAWGWSETRFT